VRAELRRLVKIAPDKLEPSPAVFEPVQLVDVHQVLTAVDELGLHRVLRRRQRDPGVGLRLALALDLPLDLLADLGCCEEVDHVLEAILVVRP
jgi:hypothetical protein